MDIANRHFSILGYFSSTIATSLSAEELFEALVAIIKIEKSWVKRNVLTGRGGEEMLFKGILDTSGFKAYWLEPVRNRAYMRIRGTFTPTARGTEIRIESGHLWSAILLGILYTGAMALFLWLEFGFSGGRFDILELIIFIFFGCLVWTHVLSLRVAYEAAVEAIGFAIAKNEREDIMESSDGRQSRRAGSSITERGR